MAPDYNTTEFLASPTPLEWAEIPRISVGYEVVAPVVKFYNLYYQYAEYNSISRMHEIDILRHLVKVIITDVFIGFKSVCFTTAIYGLVCDRTLISGSMV